MSAAFYWWFEMALWLLLFGLTVSAGFVWLDNKVWKGGEK